MQEIIAAAQEWLGTRGPEYGMKIVAAILIFVFGRIVMRVLLRALKSAIERYQRLPDLLESFVVGTAEKVLFLVLIILVIDQFIDVAPLIAGLGIAGFVLGFALQDTLGNLAAGFMLLLNQPFNVGDSVDVGGTVGSVQGLNLSATTLHTGDNKVITIPNGEVWGNTIINYSALDTRRIEWGVGIAYSSDIGKAQEVILGVLNGEELVLEDPGAQVELREMGDSSLNLMVRAWAKTEDYWDVFFKLNKEIKESLDEAGIDMPFPQMDVHWEGGPGVMGAA